jgi:hypothetical protein
MHFIDPFMKELKHESEPTEIKEIIPTDQPHPHLSQTFMLSPTLSPFTPTKSPAILSTQEYWQ